MTKLITARSLYLIVRGPKSKHHNAPYHPIIVCTRKHTAKWESLRTEDGHTMFVNMAPDSPSGNWLLVKYKGYDIDYGNVAANFTLYDGVKTSDATNRKLINEYLNGATWWSYDLIPEWLSEYGIKLPEDDFTKQRIWDDAGSCLLKESEYKKLREKRQTLSRPEWLNI